MIKGFDERYGHLRDLKNNVRYHVTANANDILNQGFAPKKGKGVGGVSNNKGFVYTTKDRKYAESMAQHMNELEHIRTSKDPLEEASQYAGRGVANYALANVMPIYEQNKGEPLTDAEKAMVIAVHGKGGDKFPEMLPTSFFRDDPKRHFDVIAVDVSKGEKKGESELFGGEEMWERGTVEPIPLKVIDEMKKSRSRHEYLTPQERTEVKKRFGNIQCTIAKDDKGYFAFTHRARSKSYPSLAQLPKKTVQFISSTA